MRDAIREYMAKTFFATAWADWNEEYGDTNVSGCEIMDLIPEEIPESAYQVADKLIMQMEKINGMPIEFIFETCRDAPGVHRRKPDEDEFGYCMAMQAMGHGVGWDDNHPSVFHEVKTNCYGSTVFRPAIFTVPNLEYSYFDLPEADYPIPEGK